VTASETLWQIVGDAGLLPWWAKAACAWAALIAVFHLPRHWEQFPLMVGLAALGTSPLLPPLGPFGDWLVWPFAVAVLWRCARTGRV
jgi:hypothetical protein